MTTVGTYQRKMTNHVLIYCIVIRDTFLTTNIIIFNKLMYIWNEWLLFAYVCLQTRYEKKVIMNANRKSCCSALNYLLNCVSCNQIVTYFWYSTINRILIIVLSLYMRNYKSRLIILIGVQIGQQNKAKWCHCLLSFAGYAGFGKIKRIFGRSNFNSVNHLEDKSTRSII